MSPTSVALISVGGTLGGALLALIGTLVTQYVTGRREDERREHEREVKRMELRDSRVERRRDERLGAYRKFYAAVHSQAIFFGPNAPEVTQEFRMQALQDLSVANTELELLAPAEVRKAADAMYHAAHEDTEVLKGKEDIFREAVRRDIGQGTHDLLPPARS